MTSAMTRTMSVAVSLGYTLAVTNGRDSKRRHRYVVIASTREGIGAGDGVRTRDILLGKQTLCQLSYSRSAYAIQAADTIAVN